MTDYVSKKIKTISFLAILLVFLQHAINFTGYIDPGVVFIGQASVNSIVQYGIGYGIARPAVAIFFLLSGYLFFRNFALEKTFEKYWSRFRTLLVPYILWNILALLFIIGLQLIPAIQNYIGSFYTGYLPGRTIGQYIQSILHHGVAFQLWFLYDLILYALIAPLLYFAVRYCSLFLLIPLCFLWLFRIPVASSVSFLHRGGFFYLIGAWLAMHPIAISESASKKLFRFMGILWIGALLVKTYVTFLPSGLTSYLSIVDNTAIILGLFTIWFGYDAAVHTRFSSWLSRQALFTFFIYAAHEPLLELLKYVGITFVGRTNATLLISYFLVPIVTYALCVLVARFLKRYTASIYSVLTGGR